MLNLLKSAVLAAVFLTFSSCSSIPITSLPKLAQLNPHTLDFANLRVAVRVDHGYRVSDGDVTLMLALRNGQTGEEKHEAFKLIVEEMPDSEFLSAQIKDDAKIYGLSFNPKDTDSLNAFQNKFSEIVEQGKSDKVRSENSFSMNVNTKGCLEKGTNPFKEMNMKVFLKPDASTDYFTFIKEKSIVLSDEATGQLQYCE